TSVLLAAFVPITAFFLITGANYYFQHLLNIAIAGVAGLFGMYALHEGLSVGCEKRGVYPRKALTIMRAWALLFAFVGIQLAWSLRPFLGDRNEPFRVFGSYQGNFYAAIIYAVNKLLQGEEKPAAPPGKQDTIPRFRGFVIPPIDTAVDSMHRRSLVGRADPEQRVGLRALEGGDLSLGHSLVESEATTRTPAGGENVSSRPGTPRFTRMVRRMTVRSWPELSTMSTRCTSASSRPTQIFASL